MLNFSPFLLLQTVSASHDINAYLPLLATGGVMVQLGGIIFIDKCTIIISFFLHTFFFYKIGVTTPHTVSNFPLMMRRISIAGSLIGGVKVTYKKIFLLNTLAHISFDFTRKLKKSLTYALSMVFILTAKLLRPRI